jgi:hypothetical protein
MGTKRDGLIHYYKRNFKVNPVSSSQRAEKTRIEKTTGDPTKFKG